ncbi:hypothetical protein [Rathayibacter sp. AY1C5]|uniref:hypothetical protein n=1 Tax=Rathayibacter sp. AY1C5 TaxID=2080538 RepID=UPI000CE9056D|nr:hypothetical protein [Rathayibacter sp. AY1C5]PPG60264.1 hypothetical protein C5C57_05540 [Rathayibacter sp. AY1C5]
MSQLITVTELKGYLDEEVNAVQAALAVNAVNEYVESETGRSWGEILSGTETHDYASVIFLRHQDVITATDVEVNGSTLGDDAYSISDTGRLVLSAVRSGFRAERSAVRVTYTYGVLFPPADLKLAALALAADFYNYVGDGQKEVTSEGIGSMRLTYSTGKDTATGGLHFATISRYRTRNV